MLNKIVNPVKVRSNIKDKTTDKISLSVMKKAPDIFVHLSYLGAGKRDGVITGFTWFSSQVTILHKILARSYIRSYKILQEIARSYIQV